MRTTIDLPEELHRIATGLARHTGRSLSQTVVKLMERGLEQRSAAPAARSSWSSDRHFLNHAAGAWMSF